MCQLRRDRLRSLLRSLRPKGRARGALALAFLERSRRGPDTRRLAVVANPQGTAVQTRLPDLRISGRPACALHAAVPPLPRDERAVLPHSGAQWRGQRSNPEPGTAAVPSNLPGRQGGARGPGQKISDAGWEGDWREGLCQPQLRRALEGARPADAARELPEGRQRPRSRRAGSLSAQPAEGLFSATADPRAGDEAPVPAPASLLRRAPVASVAQPRLCVSDTRAVLSGRHVGTQRRGDGSVAIRSRSLYSLLLLSGDAPGLSRRHRSHTREARSAITRLLGAGRRRPGCNCLL